MSREESDAFLDGERTVICASNGVGGWPHLMPLWYVRRPTGPGAAGEIWAWTFAKSQKARNVERDRRVTLQVEAGEHYAELRGVMLETEAVIHRDVETVRSVGLDVLRRYAGTASGELDDGTIAMVESQAAKRIALQFVERRRVSWDHRKLAGAY